MKIEVLAQLLDIDSQLGQELQHRITERQEFEVHRASPRQTHVAALVKLVPLRMAPEIVVVVKNEDT